jgi:antitoxin HicB
VLQAYPVAFTRDSNGTVIAEIPDIPGAMTVGKDRAQALERIQDAVVVMLSGLMAQGEPIPAPSTQKRGQIAIPLPPMVAAKLAIYQSMRASRLTQSDLARKLRCDPKQVRRLLDLDHNSRFDHLESALSALGKKLVVDVRDAA